MAVVNLSYKFIYVSVGAQGRLSGIFAQSDFKAALDSALLNIPAPEKMSGSEIEAPYWFVGDEAYPLRGDLMKPYPFGLLEQEQRNFNYRLSSG